MFTGSYEFSKMTTILQQHRQQISRGCSVFYVTLNRCSISWIEESR